MPNRRTTEGAPMKARVNLDDRGVVTIPAALRRAFGLKAGEELEVVPSAVFPLPVTLAEKDVPLLCSAIRARSDYFVTGDRRDFGHLFGTRVHGALVITPLMLAEVLAGRVPETEADDQP